MGDHDAAINGLCWLDFCTLSLTLLFALANTVRYLIMEGKWRIYYLSVFYLLVIILTCSRFTFLVLRYNLLEDTNENNRKERAYFVLNLIALYSYIVIGVLKVASI